MAMSDSSDVVDWAAEPAHGVRQRRPVQVDAAPADVAPSGEMLLGGGGRRHCSCRTTTGLLGGAFGEAPTAAPTAHRVRPGFGAPRWPGRSVGSCGRIPSTRPWTGSRA